MMKRTDRIAQVKSLDWPEVSHHKAFCRSQLETFKYRITLIEVLIILSIICLFVSISSFTFGINSKERQLTKVTDYYEALFHTARRQALAVANGVTVCQTANNSSCAHVFDPNNSWLTYSVKVSEGGRLTEKRLLSRKPPLDFDGESGKVLSKLYRVDFDHSGQAKLYAQNSLSSPPLDQPSMLKIDANPKSLEATYPIIFSWNSENKTKIMAAMYFDASGVFHVDL